jgi:2-polyprenyl-3-methyl-5-hydroxy-6-metoxy-1,4-benzoquinol methylase
MTKPTVITELYANQATKAAVSAEYSYKGLSIHALAGLHDFIGELGKKIFPQPARLLDIAAGSGAMALRLQEMGHTVTACDYVKDNFRLHDSIEFFQLDLNTQFSAVLPDLFDGVIAVEIIEHLENPRNFLREIFAKLAPGGRLILTTPNLDNPVSIAMFIRLGWFQFRLVSMVCGKRLQKRWPYQLDSAVQPDEMPG